MSRSRIRSSAMLEWMLVNSISLFIAIYAIGSSRSLA